MGHVIGFSNSVDLWTIAIKEPMILCACITSNSSGRAGKLRSHEDEAFESEKMPRFHHEADPAHDADTEVNSQRQKK